MIRRVLDALYVFAGALSGLFLILVFLIMMVMSVGRQFELNVPAGDDFAAWAMAAMAFLGLAHTFKRGELIRMGLLVENMHGRPRQVLELIALSLASAIVLFGTWHAGHLAYDSWRFNDLSQGVVAVPLWLPQLGFFVGMAILSIAIVDELVGVLGGGLPRYAKPPPRTREEVIERAASGNL